jgi:3-isopropylmalate dehydrogenase
MRLTIAVLGGDGIGPEVTEQAVRILRQVSSVYGHQFDFEYAAMGGAAIRQFGSPFPKETQDVCLAADAVLLGAVGSPEFDHLPSGKKPESGLLALRKALGGFANLRPVICHHALLGGAPLKPEIAAATDVMIVRELLGGLYFGEPRGFDAERSSAHNTMRYSRQEVERVARIAFDLARNRRRKLTSADKANVLEVSQLWREVVTSLSREYPDVTLEHIYVDACAMKLVTKPNSFDVIVTENLFGDILSDEAAVITGSLGMLASATIGGDVDLYEPVHGSAPDIAGKGVANPLGAIASAAMLLRHTAGLEQEAKQIEAAISGALHSGLRTPDIAAPGETSVGTEQMGAAVDQTIAAAAQSVVN